MPYRPWYNPDRTNAGENAMSRRTRLFLWAGLLLLAPLLVGTISLVFTPGDAISAASFSRLKVGMREAEAVAVLGINPDYRQDLRRDNPQCQVDAVGWRGSRDTIVLWIDNEGAVANMFYYPDSTVHRSLLDRLRRWFGF
jgi:hypothetical protein